MSPLLTDHKNNMKVSSFLWRAVPFWERITILIYNNWKVCEHTQLTQGKLQQKLSLFIHPESSTVHNLMKQRGFSIKLGGVYLSSTWFKSINVNFLLYIPQWLMFSYAMKLVRTWSLIRNSLSVCLSLSFWRFWNTFVK